MRTALRSITERLLQDAIEFISSEELNNTEKIEQLKTWNQVVQEKLDLIKWLHEQILEFEESVEGVEECLQEATQLELKPKKDIMCITNFMDSFKITETRLNVSCPAAKRRIIEWAIPLLKTFSTQALVFCFL